MESTLEVFKGDTVIFQSNRNWLYPLFDLHTLLENSEYNPADLIVRDKVVGRAAALMIIHFGIREVQAGILSIPGSEVLDFYQIEYSFHQIVDRIDCKTEEILKKEIDTDKAFRVLQERAGFAGKDPDQQR